MGRMGVLLRRATGAIGRPSVWLGLVLVLEAAIRQLVRLLLAHAGGRLADDVLLVLSEPVGVRDVLSSPL
jgi:hypothetical protein